jgi:hypothetical protein
MNSDTAKPSPQAERDEIIEVLTNICQILDVVKWEWSAENSWSKWDQSVRDEISRILRKLYAERGEIIL